MITALHQDTHTIAEFCEFIDSGRAISDRLDKAGIPAYEVGHISPCELKAPTYLVSPDTDKILKRHDLLTGRVGGLGAVAEYESDMPASFSDNVLRIRPKEQNKARSAFVAEYLNSSIGNTQLLRGSRGSLQKVITQSSLGSIVVPSLGELETEITSAMNTARVEYKTMLTEADALLMDIDDFVLTRLGITMPMYEPKRAFAIHASQLGSQYQFGSNHYHPERINALSTLHAASHNLTVSRLADVVRFERNQLKKPVANYLSLAHVQSHTGELTDATDTASGNCVTFQTDNVLFARLRPYLNKVYCAEMNGCCSTEFHVLRVNDPNALLPEYLAAALRSRIILAQTTHMAAGNTHPRLTNYDVENLLVPIPELEAQESIVAEIRRRRQKARRLRAQADVVLRDAKRRFEAQLLGGVGNC